MGGTTEGDDVTRPGPDIRPSDVAVAVSAGLIDTIATAGGRARTLLGPLARAVLRPPLLPASLWPETPLAALTRSGEARREALAAEVEARLDAVVPVVVDEVLRRTDLTDLVLRHVDLDRVVSTVDVDAVVERVDLPAVVQRVDVDQVVKRVDLDAVAARLDVDAVAARLDVDAVLDRVDLTAVVLRRVDLNAIVEEVLARLDLVALAAEVMDGVDLPEIIRESTGSMASDTVRGVRMQGIAADEALSRAVDRLLLRRGDRTTQAPGDQREPKRADSTR